MAETARGATTVGAVGSTEDVCERGLEDVSFVEEFDQMSWGYVRHGGRLCQCKCLSKGLEERVVASRHGSFLREMERETLTSNVRGLMCER